MAFLQTIRTKAGVLIAVVIGLSLLAFILGDFLGGDGPQNTDQTIAEISGDKIPYAAFQTRLFA